MHVNAQRVIMRRVQEIDRTLYAEATFIQYVCVDHCRPNVFVAQEFLHGSDVVAGFDQMCGEAMPKCVGRNSFCNISASHCGGNCPADCREVKFRRADCLNQTNRSESVCQELFQRICREALSRLADGGPADGKRTSRSSSQGIPAASFCAQLFRVG